MSAFQYPTKPKPENAKYALAEYAKHHGLKRPFYKATLSQAAAAVQAPHHHHGGGDEESTGKVDGGGSSDTTKNDKQQQQQQQKKKKVPVGHYKCSVEIGDRIFSSDELFSTTKKAQIAAASLALKRISEGECPTRGGGGASASATCASRHHLAVRAKGSSLPLHVRLAQAALAPSRVPRVAFAIALLAFLQNLPPHFEYADHGVAVAARSPRFSLLEDIAGSQWDSSDRGCAGNDWWRPVGVALYRALGTAPSIVRHLGSALLHSAAVATLASIVLKIALPHNDHRRLDSAEPLNAETLRVGAAALGSALLFALHPAQTTVLRFAESQHEILAGLLGMLAAYFAVDDVVVVVLRPSNGPSGRSNAVSQHDDDPHFGSSRRTMKIAPAVACAVLAPFAGAAGVLGIAVLVFLSVRLKFRVALPTKEAHDLGASMLYVGVMTLLVLYAARTLLLERSDGSDDEVEQGGIVQAVFATFGAIVFFPVAALQSVCQVGLWPWVDLLWSVTTGSSSLSGAASSNILSDPLSLASLALVALSLAVATTVALNRPGHASAAAAPQEEVRVGSVPPPSPKVQATALLRDLGLALLLGVPTLQFAVVGDGTTGAPVCTRWTAAAEATSTGHWNALSLYVPVAGFALVCASVVVGGVPMPFSSSTAAVGGETVKAQLQALAWIAGLSFAVVVAASSAHVGIHGGSAIEAGSPLCGAELGLYYQRGWQASRHQSWTVARQAFAFAFSPQCAPNTIQSAALHGFGRTYQQQALVSLESAAEPGSVRAAEREQAGRDASERLLSRAAAALRLSCQAFPNSYGAQMTLGRLLNDEGSGAHAVEAARCFEAAAHIAAADVAGRSRPQEYEARELLALARLRVGDAEGAAAALEVSDEFTSKVSTPNAIYTLALVHGSRLARAAAAGASLNVKDEAMQRMMHLYEMAAEAGHSNAQSIVAARKAAIATTSGEEAVGSNLDDLDARWWGRHLAELVATVQDYQVTGEAASTSDDGLRLSTHLGYPLRSPEADPFLSGPSCHFSVATVTVEWGLPTVVAAVGNTTTTTTTNANANATEPNIETCVASRVDGCADAILGDKDIADFVQKACLDHVQSLDLHHPSSSLGIEGDAATPNNSSAADGLAASPQQQRRHTFRAYIDHRLPFTVNVDDQAAGHSFLVGYMDDPWAVGAIACQVFVTTQSVVDDVVPSDCERRVGQGVDSFLTQQRLALFSARGTVAAPGWHHLHHRVADTVKRLLCTVAYAEVAAVEYFVVHRDELCKSIETAVAVSPGGLTRRSEGANGEAIDSWSAVATRLASTVVSLEFARAEGDDIAIRLNLWDPEDDIANTDAESGRWWPRAETATLLERSGQSNGSGAEGFAIVGNVQTPSPQCHEHALSHDECLFVASQLFRKQTAVAAELLSEYRFPLQGGNGSVDGVTLATLAQVKHAVVAG